MFLYSVVVCNTEEASTPEVSGGISFKKQVFFTDFSRASSWQKRWAKQNPGYEVHILKSDTFMMSKPTDPTQMRVTEKGEVLPV